MSKFVLTAQLQLQAPNNVGQVVQQIQNQLNGINVNIQVQGSQQAQKQIQQVTQSTNQATTAAERMGKAFALSIRRFAAFSIATRGVGLFTSSLSNAIQTAIDFERELIKVSQVTGKSITQLRGLTNQITSLSTGLGVSSNDLLNVTTVLAQAGLTAEDTSKALRVLAKSALAPNFDSITETTEGAIAILAQFQEGVGALEKQLGSINAVAGAFAVEAGDLIDVVRRTGGVFKSSGGSLNELLALFTSVRATTRESAESIGTGLRTIFTRIQRPKTIEFLKQFGVELVDLNGKFVGPYEAIKRLSEALSGLGEGDLTFISIAEELGGFRQIGKVLPLLQQFSTAQSALNVAMKSSDSLTQDAASAQASLAIRIMKVREEFLALIRSVTETSTFQIMANTALSLASALIKIADSIKPLLPMLAALAAFKIAKGLGGFFGGMMSGATSGRAYNKGGKVHHFASGGLVPGSGNRDTVPAMLSPGEFVIRKSSVNKMGAGTLAAMNNNRYAYGGKARTFGIAALDGTQDSKSSNLPISAIREKLGINTDKVSSKDLDMVIRGVLGSKGSSNLNVTAKSDTVTLNDPGIKDAIYNNIKSQMYGLITSSATALSTGTGIPMRKRAINPNKVLAKVGTDSTIGSVFEGALGLLGGPFSAGKSTAAIDYPRGLGKMASAFSSLSDMPVDAKKTADSKKTSEMLNKKIPNFFAEFVKRSPQYASFKTQLSQGKLDKLKGREFDLDEYRRVTGNSKVNTGDLSQIANFSRKSGNRQFFTLKNLGGIIQKFAKGGGVARDPKDTLQSFFEGNPLYSSNRKETANKIRDMRSLRSAAPQLLYSSISRNAFDLMAAQTGLNKNPKIPEGTKLFDREKYYDQEAKKIIGKTFKLSGFLSTSKEMNKAKMFLDNADRSKDNWAAMMTIMTKKNATGVDVEKQLSGRKVGGSKQALNPRTGKMETFYQKPPESESEFTLQPGSRFKVNSSKLVDMMGRKNLWMDVQQFKEGGEAEIPKRTIRGLFSDQDVAAAAQRKSMSFAQLKADLEARHDTGFKDYKVPDWEIKKKYGLVPSAFNVGAYSAAAAARDKEKTAAFHNRKRFAAGGGVGTDTVPALLTPGEFVVNRKSAQGIGYGALNRMNKVGKYAKGGVVQHFAGGSTGSGVKSPSPFAASSMISIGESVMPGLIKSLSAYATASNMSTTKQEKLTATIEKIMKDMQDGGKSLKEVGEALDRLKKKADNKTKQLNDAFDPMSKGQMQKQTLTGAKKSLANISPIYKGSASSMAFDLGISKEEAAKQKKQAFQDAGFTKGSAKTNAILSGSQAPAPMTTADKIAAAKGKSSPTSSGGSGSPGKSPSGGGGMGNMLNDNKMMALSMASSIAQGFLPAIDESSSAMLKMSHGMLGLITTVASVGFALEAFGLKLNAQNISSALGGIGSLFKGGGLSALAGKVGGTAAAGGVVKGGLGGMASQGVFAMGGSAGTSAKVGLYVKDFASGLTRVAAPLAATAATFYALKTGGDMLVEAYMGYGKSLKEATEKGNINKAREVGTDQQTAKNRVTVGAGVAAGAVGGAMIGTAIMPVIGTAVGAAVGAALGGLTAFTSTELPEYAGALAAAQAAQVDAQVKLTKATEDSSKSLEEYSKGTKSGLEVVQTSVAAAEAVAKSRVETNKANKLGLQDRGILSGGTGIGLGIGATSRLKDSEDRTKAQNKLEEKALNVSMPGLNALGRDVALASGSFEDFQAKIKEVNPELFNIIVRQGSVDLKKNFDNIAKETEKAKKAFEALNLNLRAPSATAVAASSGLSNFNANLEIGSNPVEQSMSALEASFSEAGQAMDPAEVKAAIGGVAATLEEFGGSDKAVAKFKENAEAFASVSQNYNEIFEGVKEDFTDADFQGLNVNQFNDKFAANVDKQLEKSGIGEEVRERMKDVIGGIKLSEDDTKKLRGGDFSVYQKYLDEAGQKTLEEAKKIVAETAKINQQLISLTKQRIEAERGLIQAQQEAIDLTMEGREIQGKYGGRAVTGKERKDSLLAKSNVESSRLGLSDMKTGDVGDLRRRNTEISTLFSDLEGRRSQQGGLQKTSGVEADAAQQDLQKAYKTQIETIRGLIKLEEDQLKIIEEKNKLEKESMESLIKGDIEEFFKKQSAVGATAAIATGDSRLQNLYGAEALGTAAMDIKRQQDAGVQTLYGQQLAGPGGLTEAASSAALSSRGVTDMRAAQVMAGTTAEEEASKTRLRELGGMLGETGQLGTEMAEMQVNTATINVNSANLKLEEIKSRGKAASEEAQDIENRPAIARARGGMIYANRGIFVPRGTDTVPAMLTPGEFVINRGAVQRGNNLQILQAMNSGAGGVSSIGGTALMAQGGPVRYLSRGNKDPVGNGGGMFDNMTNFVTSLSNFGLQLKDSIGKLTDTNISIKLDSSAININLNDGGLLKALTSQVKTEIFNLVKNNLVAGDGGRLKESSSILP